MLLRINGFAAARILSAIPTCRYRLCTSLLHECAAKLYHRTVSAKYCSLQYAASAYSLKVPIFKTRWQVCLTMFSKLSRFIAFCTISASCTPGSRAGHHPLCRALDNGKHPPSTQFPWKYTCHSDREDDICTWWGAATSGANTEKVSVYWVLPGINPDIEV